MNVRDAVTAILVLSSLLRSTSAQTTLGTYPGNSGLDRMQAVAGGRDLDGDGIPDFLLGAPDDGGGAGSVYAHSGSSGAVLWTVQGSSGDRLGHALALIDDLTGDGVPEVLAGAPGATESPGNSPGAVSILSGASGGTFLVRWGEYDGGELGYSVTGEFDYDRDGVEDFAAGAPGASEARIWSGANGAELTAWFTYSFSDRFGTAVAGVGDLNGDGFRDLGIGGPDYEAFNTPPGAGLFSVVTEEIELHSVVGGAAQHLGSSLAPADDFDHDGYPDFLVGSIGGSGRVELLSGDTGNVLASWTGNAPFDHFGYSLALLGDVDGDGVRDFAAGAPQPSGYGPGFVRVVSLKFGTELYTLHGVDDDDLFGERVSGVGDVNDDGVPDLGVGDPGWDQPGGITLKFNQGRVTLFSGGGPGFVNYCTAGTSASGCQVQVSGSGTPSWYLASGFTLTAMEVEGDKSGIFFYGTNGRQANPWGNGTSYQCVVPPVKRAGVLPKAGTSGACDGSYLQDLNAFWQAHPNQRPGPGDVVQAQLWYRDPGNTSNQTTTLSNALEFALDH